MATLQSRSKFAVMALWSFAAVSVGTALTEFMEGFGLLNIETDASVFALIGGFAYVAYVIVFIAAIVLVGMWIHRAHSNLHEAGLEGLEFTPGWAVGWYFVPFANLVKPFGAMRELWNASHGEADQFGAPAPDEVKVWWGSWILGNILSSVSTRIIASGGFETGSLIGAASTVTLIVASLLLAKVIRGVTVAQSEGMVASEVFA